MPLRISKDSSSKKFKMNKTASNRDLSFTSRNQRIGLSQTARPGTMLNLTPKINNATPL